MFDNFDIRGSSTTRKCFLSYTKSLVFVVNYIDNGIR